MKPAMTSRERMLSAITRKDHDRVPFSPYIEQGPQIQWKEHFLWRDQEGRAECLLALEMDPILDIWFPDPQPHPDVTIKTWRDTTGPEPLLTKEYHTPAGVLRQTVHETDDWCSWRHSPWIPTTFGVERRDHYGMDLFDDHNVSRRTEPWVKGPEDLEKLKYIIRPLEGYLLDEWVMDTRRAMKIAKKYNIMTMARRTIVGDAYQWFCDIPAFMMMLLDNPAFVQEFFAIFQKWALKLAELALDAGVDVIQRRGWYEISTMLGPERFKKFIVPGIEQETTMVHQAGKLHSYLLPEGHGAYAEILKDMKVDVLQGIDPRMLHGGDLGSFFQKCGSKHAFWGGVNAEVTLHSQDAGKIDREVKEAIRVLDNNNGLILSAFLFPDVPQQSILSMIESWKKYRKRNTKSK